MKTKDEPGAPVRLSPEPAPPKEAPAAPAARPPGQVLGRTGFGPHDPVRVARPIVELRETLGLGPETSDAVVIREAAAEIRRLRGT